MSNITTDRATLVVEGISGNGSAHVGTDDTSLIVGRTARDRADPGSPAPVTCLTMACGLRFGAVMWLKALFGSARLIPKIPEPMYRLAFIHFLRWTLLETVPDGKGGTHKLRPACLLFEGDFDGNVSQYIDTFIQAVPVREWSVWSRGRGFPGLRPVSGFVKWVNTEHVTPDHYWCAYPDATTMMVASGLRVADAVAAFDAAAADVDDDGWFEHYQRLLATVQRDI